MNEHFEKLESIWESLYGEKRSQVLRDLLRDLEETKGRSFKEEKKKEEKEWYKDAVIYCTYVDLFATSFQKFEEKLDYLQQLGKKPPHFLLQLLYFFSQSFPLS